MAQNQESIPDDLSVEVVDRRKVEGVTFQIIRTPTDVKGKQFEYLILRNGKAASDAMFRRREAEELLRRLATQRKDVVEQQRRRQQSRSRSASGGSRRRQRSEPEPLFEFGLSFPDDGGGGGDGPPPLLDFGLGFEDDDGDDDEFTLL